MLQSNKLLRLDASSPSIDHASCLNRSDTVGEVPAAPGMAAALMGSSPRSSPVSLRPQQPLPPVPDDTARVARAAFPRGNPYYCCATGSGPCSPTPTSPTSTRGWPAGLRALAPGAGHALQFREGLSDRQAAEAVRAGSTGSTCSASTSTDPGFDYSVLCEFRGRLLAGDASDRLLARLLDAAREARPAQGARPAAHRQRPTCWPPCATSTGSNSWPRRCGPR